MNRGRLTTNKNNKQVEISADRFNAVLSTPPFYVYKDGVVMKLAVYGYQLKIRLL